VRFLIGERLSVHLVPSGDVVTVTRIDRRIRVLGQGFDIPF
jgi:hypothetical protein